MSEQNKRTRQFPPQERVCVNCGMIYTAHGNRAKYCPECAEVIRKKQSRERSHEWRQERKKYTTREHTCDSDEQIQACLNCKAKRCSGDCARVRSKPEPAVSQEQMLPVKERREMEKQLRAQGMTYSQIADALGCSKKTVEKDFYIMRIAEAKKEEQHGVVK